MKVAFIYSKPIRAFCQKIVSGSKPIYVPVQPLPDKPINECFTIIPEHILTNGGEQEFGWSIWHWPRVYVEAEFHCIWKNPDGKRVDLTPKELPFKIEKILFLPDPHRKYKGVQVDNIRKPLSKDPLIKNYISLAKERFRKTNKGNLAYQHGNIPRTDRLRDIDNQMREIELLLLKRFGPPC